MEQIRISAKNLGAFALPHFCPRCAWIKLHVKNLPFQIFPGIFSSIDAYNKQIIHSWFDKHKCSPVWLGALGELKSYINPPSYHTFNIVNSEYNIMLTGSADGIFLRPDGSYVIVDYKTAKYTGKQDALFPIYEAQLNSYALIGKEKGIDPISCLALVYMEPMTDKDNASDDNKHFEKGFFMGFSANVLEVDLNTEIIFSLFRKVREIYDMVNPPEGFVNCKDCLHLDQLIHSVQLQGKRDQDLFDKKLKRILFGDTEEIKIKFFNECIEREFSDQYKFEFKSEKTDSGILRLAESNVFDIYVLVLNNIMFESGNAPAEERLWKKALWLVTHLVKTYKKPVIAFYGWPDDPSYSEKVIEAGASVVFQLPTDIPVFLKAVEKCLN